MAWLEGREDLLMLLSFLFVRRDLPFPPEICIPIPDKRRTRVRNLVQSALAISNGVLRRLQP